jgi:hypothetical protein
MMLAACLYVIQRNTHNMTNWYRICQLTANFETVSYFLTYEATANKTSV